jgi:hypothetical protein
MLNERASKHLLRGLWIPIRYGLGDLAREVNKCRVSGIYCVLKVELDQDSYTPVTAALNKTMTVTHAV